MRPAPLLLWSMRSPWRSAWWWSLIAVAALGPAVLARALNLSILDAGTSSTPQEWNLLAVLAGSLLGLRFGFFLGSFLAHCFLLVGALIVI